MVEKINRAAIRAISESYADWGIALNLSQEAIEKAIESIARQMGGCINCIYSIAPPFKASTLFPPSHLPIKRRGCILRLTQSGCTAREPIIQKE